MDQWMLAGVLVVAGVLFAAKAWLDNGGAERAGAGGAGGKSPAKLLQEEYAVIGRDWRPPLTLTSQEHRAFVSRLIVYSPQTGNIEWLDPDKKMSDGITAAWKLKYGFSIEDPNLKEQDADNDGFANMEEYLAGTDPTDPKSRPSILVKLHMTKYTKVDFRFEFKAANNLADGTREFQLNLLDVTKNKTRFVKYGMEFEGYRVGDYREKNVMEERGGVTYNVNRSELDLINIKLDEVVTLVLNTKKESDESHVTFQIDIPDARLTPEDVKRGDTFKLSYKQDGQPAEMEFQLLKGNPEGATIKNTKTGEELQIGVKK
jgi:hypothetical protein